MEGLLMNEQRVTHINGYLGLLITLCLLAGAAWLGLQDHYILTIILVVIAAILLSSLTIVNPNEGKVVTFFGSYLGTIRDSGLFMTVPFTYKQTISLRVRNFNSQILKVNDSQGNPVEIAAVIVFNVIDTAQALFSVDDYEAFVEIQSEAAIRHVASEYPYDTLNDDDQLTLRGNPTEVSARLAQEVQERLQVAGVKIIETRLTHLAYATEIASAMLQKQQSAAILAARKTIVDGAVSITNDALNRLASDTGLTLTEQQKLDVINNIMVAIISDRGAQPVLKVGK